MTDYLVGTGGWGYFKVPKKSSLKVYSEIFNFVEVNYTFYEYPHRKRVERWRRTVPSDFTFAVRCHQDLTHRIGLKPVDEANSVLSRMINYCEILDAPFLILETPSSYLITHDKAEKARDFFSSSTLRDIRLVWEVRAPMTGAVLDLMRDFNIIECVDLSTRTPTVESDVVYSRLFGRGKHNIYQFTDEELVSVDHQVERINPQIAALSYHSVRMHIDATRYLQYKKTGEFIPATNFTGIDSARAVLLEDTKFPLSKLELIDNQGWKVIDLTLNCRVRLSDLLTKLPDKIYHCVDEVTETLETLF